MIVLGKVMTNICQDGSRSKRPISPRNSATCYMDVSVREGSAGERSRESGSTRVVRTRNHTE